LVMPQLCRSSPAGRETADRTRHGSTAKRGARTEPPDLATSPRYPCNAKLMGAAAAECVSAPTLIRCAPAAA